MTTPASRYQEQLREVSRSTLRKMVAENRRYTEYPEVVSTVIGQPSLNNLSMSWSELAEVVRTSPDSFDIEGLVSDTHSVGQALEDIVREAVRRDVEAFLNQSKEAHRSVAVHRTLAALRGSDPYADNYTRLVRDAHEFSETFDYDFRDPGTYELPNGDHIIDAPVVTETDFHEGHVRGVELIQPYGETVLSTLYAWVWEEHPDTIRRVTD